MSRLPLFLESNHLFLEIDRKRYLVDTGAPHSFGSAEVLELEGERFGLADAYLGLDVRTLSAHVGTECSGLVGADILGQFDSLFDVEEGVATFSLDELSHAGEPVPLEFCMGIPILEAHVGGRDFRMFLDTGAQVSYLQDGLLGEFPPAGSLEDFYPGFGTFKTETHRALMVIGGETITLRTGRLPALLGTTLMMAGTQGIVGLELFRNRVIGYFPRRAQVVLG